MKRQCQIAAALSISDAQISRIFSGKSAVGKASALKIEAATGTPWNIVIAMEPDEIRQLVTAALSDRKQQAA